MLPLFLRHIEHVASKSTCGFHVDAPLGACSQFPLSAAGSEASLDVTSERDDSANNLQPVLSTFVETLGTAFCFGVRSMIANGGYDLAPIFKLFNTDQVTTDELTSSRVQFIRDVLIPCLDVCHHASLPHVRYIVSMANDIFEREDTVGAVSASSGETVTVVGDIHGNLHDLVTIFSIRGFPSPVNKFIFNGDIVDRGEKSVACLFVILALKITLPHAVFVTRGNHESDICGRERFFRECSRMSPSFHGRCQQMFTALPVAYVINEKVFVVHGGIGKSVKLDEIRKENRMKPSQNFQNIMHVFMWADPTTRTGIFKGKRGPFSPEFGPDATARFLRENNLDLIVRSHECCEKGFKEEHDGKCLTIFSASGYVGSNNSAAVLVFDENLERRLYSYDKNGKVVDSQSRVEINGH